MVNYYKVITFVVLLAVMRCQQTNTQFQPNQNTLKDSQEETPSKKENLDDNSKTEIVNESKLEFWINFRYNMEFNSTQLIKTARMYKPEESSYMTQLKSYAWFSYLLGAVFGAVFLFYMIGRFILGKFKGPKVLLSQGYTKISLLILVLSMITLIVLLGLSVHNINKVK